MMGLPTVLEATCIQSIIQTFCEAYGIYINKEKSHIFFFNTPLSDQLQITQLLGFTQSSLPSKYLGIPLIEKAMRNNSWEDLMSNIRKKISSWNFRSLNFPGRLIFLEYVLQALPIYSFSTLATPNFILTAIRNMQRKFLWKGTKEG